jgi:hypothetical protein
MDLKLTDPKFGHQMTVDESLTDASTEQRPITKPVNDQAAPSKRQSALSVAEVVALKRAR